MKKNAVGLIVGMMCLVSMGRGDSRLFTDTQGRSIEAELVRYDAQSRQVTIKRVGSRKEMTVSASVFSDKDQDYIQEWARGQAILDRRLTVGISRVGKNDKENTYGTSASTQVYVDHYFNLDFENGTKTHLENLDLEYVIYYEQEHHINNGTKVENRKGWLCQKESISLPGRKTTEFKTKSVKLYSWETYNLAPVNSDIEGIRVRLTLTLSTGEKVTRDYSYPKSLNLPWKTEASNALRRP